MADEQGSANDVLRTLLTWLEAAVLQCVNCGAIYNSAFTLAEKDTWLGKMPVYVSGNVADAVQNAESI